MDQLAFTRLIEALERIAARLEDIDQTLKVANHHHDRSADYLGDLRSLAREASK